MEENQTPDTRFSLEALVRPSIRKVKPYSTARDDFQGQARVFLDANENSLGSPLMKWYNRYPDPHQLKLKEKISLLKQVSPGQIFLGNGSDECIDILYRIFCEPGESNVIICPPTYGMYSVSAAVNNVEIREVPLLVNYQLDVEMILAATDENTRMIWICSPNNPTGNMMERLAVETLLNNFSGLVVVDEAYINFSRYQSMLPDLNEYTNLAVIQTFSKAWGLAGLRIGMLFASKDLIRIADSIKPPYNISQPAQEILMQALDNTQDVNAMIMHLVDMREALMEVFAEMPIVMQVYPSEANFFLVKIMEAKKVYAFLIQKGIIVRDRSNVTLCEECLRITVGTEEENTLLVDALIDYMKILAEKYPQ